MGNYARAKTNSDIVFCHCDFLYLLHRFSHDKSKPYLFPLALITSGAFGNLWDRLFFNGVRDFLDFNLGFMQWPTFNLADVFIVIGVISYCLIELYIGTKKQPQETTEKNTNQ